MTAATFRPHERINDPKDFRRAFERRKSASDERLIVYGVENGRDYPRLADPDEYRSWSRSGTARVLFGNWVEPDSAGGATLHSETRVEAFGLQGQIGLASVRPLIRGFQQLIWSDAMVVAARRAEAA